MCTLHEVDRQGDIELADSRDTWIELHGGQRSSSTSFYNSRNVGVRIRRGMRHESECFPVREEWIYLEMQVVICGSFRLWCVFAPCRKRPDILQSRDRSAFGLDSIGHRQQRLSENLIYLVLPMVLTNFCGILLIALSQLVPCR